MPDIPVLSLIPRGQPEHPWFIPADQHQRVWTGRDWSTDEEDAVLFANMKDVAKVTTKLLCESTTDRPSFKFVAPVEIEVRAGEPPDLTALMVWVIRSARLFVDYRQPGLADVTAILSIDWTEMREAAK